MSGSVKKIQKNMQRNYASVSDTVLKDRIIAEQNYVIKRSRDFNAAQVALAETLTTIKTIGSNLDIPQTRTRAVEQLQGIDKVLHDQWDTVRQLLLDMKSKIPPHVPAVIHAREEVVATFLQTNGSQWRQLHDHVLKTANFGFENLVPGSQYDSGGQVNGRLWLVDRIPDVESDNPGLSPGGILNKIKEELEAEHLPKYDSGLSPDVKQKIRALETLQHYGYDRAGELYRELRRVAKNHQKITHV